jgi:hypothetical protein
MSDTAGCQFSQVCTWLQGWKNVARLPAQRNFFLCAELPRSRRYGRTAALRLLVQPCDEDDQFSSFFRVMGTGGMKLTGENRRTRGKNLSQCHFVHHTSHMD